MNRNLLIADVAIALLIGVLLLVLSPGLAVAGIIAILILVVVALSILWNALRDRRRFRRGAGRR